MSLVLEQVTANLSGKVRREKLHGRDYLVAPLSMIVPGVLNGSDGPILYTAEEGAKYPEVWNNMPIVVNHPKDKDGSHISARDPDVLNSQGIGYVFRSKHDNKLQSEGWFDCENTRRIEPRIYTALERNQPMEVSTGLFSDKELAPPNATHNGVSYSKVAKNYRPDHLAVLPDTIGACSVRDGCGLNVNEDEKRSYAAKASLLTRIVETLLGTKSHNELLNLNEIEDRLTDNAKREMSFEERREKISAAFREMYPYKYSGDGLSDTAYITQVYDTYLICRNNGDYYRHNYSMDKSGSVTIEKTATKVQRVESYVAISNSAAEASYEPVKTTNEAANSQPLIANQQGATNMLNDQQKKQIVDNLITNCGCQGPKIFNEQDRDYLAKLPDDRLTALDESRKRVGANDALIGNIQKGVKVGNSTISLNSAGELVAAKLPEAPKFTDPQGRVYVLNEATQSYVLQSSGDTQQTQQPPNQQAAPFVNLNRQLTEEEWKRLAPPKQQQMAANYERWETDQKNQLISNIQANPLNVFSVEQLQAMEMQMLRNLAAMSGNAGNGGYAAPNFAGAASPFSVNTGSAGGFGKFSANEDADMATPEIDWSSPKLKQSA